jgi:crotonobetainyl-CoA:carnitine CoA-transferase CaiB-like acyl-CoA transferase
VLDLGTFWAGPYLGMYLASLGADVIKVESTGRPDGFRFVGVADVSSDRWFERGVLFQATNLGKRNLTLDLNQEQGRDLLRRLIAGADVLIENFAPRVMERFGFDYANVRELRPDIVMLRMPAYGLEGPWRDYVGWALAIAQAAGISWVTGTPSGKPRNSGAFLDCAIGMHAGVALQAALAHRRRTGEGQLIEVAQFETALCICPEPAIDYSLNGRVQGRRGNRSDRFAPQGVYAGRDGELVAISVRDTAEWERLVELLGKPGWSQDPDFATTAGRRKRHDEIDERIAAWTREQAASEVAELLLGRGIPAAELLVNARMYDDPQLSARAYYQSIEHPVSGVRRYPVWPMRFSFSEGEVYAGPTPTLGQHNGEILGRELGLDPATVEELEQGGVIGQHWSPGGSA